MRKLLILIILTIFCIFSCDLMDSYSLNDRSRDSVTRPRDDSKENLIPTHKSDTSVYVMGVEFPNDYNWVRDTNMGAISYNTILFENGRRIVSIPSSDNTFFDTKILLGGHIYTCFSGGGNTVVARDGAEIFRYEGIEKIYGILEKDGDIYTLGQRKWKSGIFYRKNGDLLFSKDDAFLINDIVSSPSRSGALYEDDGSVWFSFYYPVKFDKKELRIWYNVKDGVPKEITLPHQLSRVYDIRVVNSVTYITGEMETSPKQYVVIGNEKIKVIDLRNSTLEHLRVINDNGIPYILSYYHKDGDEDDFVSLWNTEGRLISTSNAGNITNVSVWNSMLAFISSGKSELRAMKGQSMIDIGTEDNFIGEKGVCFCLGKLFVVMTDFSNKKSCLMIDKKKEDISINGYLTDVEVIKNK